MIEELSVNPFYGQMLAAAKGRLKLSLRVLPVHAYVVLRSEWHLAKVRWKTRRTPLRYQDARHLLVNLGAGSRGRAGWVNVDAWPNANINCVFDSRKRLPFPDCSVKAIFTEHFVEHLDYTEEVPRFLTECHRVLEPGGVIRIVVPDAERYVRAYCEDGWEGLSRLRKLTPDRQDPFLTGRYETKMQLLNVLFRQGHEHKYAYDHETLASALVRYGFVKVSRASFGVSRLPELAIDEPDRAIESLYVEGVRA